MRAQGRVVGGRPDDRRHKFRGRKDRTDSEDCVSPACGPQDQRCRKAQLRDVLRDAVVIRPAPCLRHNSRPNQRVPVRRVEGNRRSPPIGIVPGSQEYRDRRKRVPVRKIQGSGRPQPARPDSKKSRSRNQPWPQLYGRKLRFLSILSKESIGRRHCFADRDERRNRERRAQRK